MAKSHLLFKALTIITLLCVAFVVLSTKTIAATGVNRQINYQGKLLDAAGDPVADGSYSMKFSLYTTDSGGTPIWTAAGVVGLPTALSVSVTDGLFSLALGDTGQNPLDINFNQDSLYLGVTIDADAEMTPRKRLTSVPYAFTAENIQGQYASSSVTSAGGAMFNLQQHSADAAIGDRTALYISTSGTSNDYDYFIKASNSSEVFTISRQGNVTTTGNLAIEGNAILGNGSGDSIIFNGSINSNLIPLSDNLYTLGNSSYRWRGLDAVNVTSTNATTTNLTVTGFSQFVGNVENLITETQSFTVVTTTVTGDAPQAVAVSGGYAYVANGGTSDSLQIFDISDITLPQLIGSVAVDDEPSNVVVSGRYAYLTTYGGSSFQIIDISDASAPVEVGRAATQVDVTSKLIVNGKFAYAQKIKGFYVIDISNPAVPQVIKDIAVAGAQANNGLFLQGNYLYVNTADGNLNIYDVTDPSNPALSGTVTHSLDARALYVSNGYAYVTGNGGGLKVIDVRTPSAPRLVKTMGGVGFLFGLTGSGRYLYAKHSLTDGSVYVVDIASSTNPILVNTLPTSGIGQGITINGKYLFTANTSDDSLSIIDISGIETTGLIAHSASIGELQVKGSAQIYNSLTLGGGLNIGQGGIMSAGSLGITGTSTISSIIGKLAIGTSTSGEQLTVVGSIQNTLVEGQAYTTKSTLPIYNEPHKIAIQGNYAYVASTSTFQQIDISDPEFPKITGIFNPPMQLNVSDIVVSGRFVYTTLATLNTTFAWDVSDPTNPVVDADNGASCSGCNPIALTNSGPYVYVVAEPNTLQIQLTTKTSFTNLVTTTTAGSNPSAVAVQGRYLYVVNRSSDDLQIFDVNTPTNPSLNATFSLGASSAPSDIKVQGRYAYITNKTASTLAIVDVSNPTTPVTMSTIATTDPTSVFVSGRYAYVTNSSTGMLSTFDVSSSTNPLSLGSISVGTSPTDVVVVGRYAYVVNYGSDSISIIDIKGIETNGLIAQTASFGALQAQDATVSNLFTVGSALNVGYGGIYTNGSLTVASTLTTSTFGFAVSSSRLMVSEEVTLASSTTIGGRNVCLSDGTNCAAAQVAASGDLNWTYDSATDVARNATATTDLILGGTATTSAPIYFKLNDVANQRLILGQSGNFDLVIGNTTSAIDNAAFQLNGADLFVYGNMGSASSVYSNAGFKAGTTDYNSSKITTGGAFAIKANALTLNSDGNITLDPVANVGGGAVYLGSAGDYIYFSGGVQSDIFPTSDNSYSLGAPDLRWKGLDVVNVTSTNATSSNIFATNAIFSNISGSTSAPVILNYIRNIGVFSTAKGSAAISGKYAYVPSSGKLAVVDISNPVTATSVGSVLSGINGISSVAVAGKYLYAAAGNGQNTFYVFDISSSTHPALLKSTTLSAQYDDIAISGNYAYMSADTSPQFTVVDISTSTPTVVASFASSTGLASANGVAVQGRFAYIASNNQFTVFDISRNSTTTVAGILRDATNLAGAQYMTVQGRYAYLAATNRFTIVDISNPATPTVAGSITDATLLAGASHVALAGKTAYVTAASNGYILAVDISTPTAPVIKHAVQDSTNFGDANGITIVGREAYVTRSYGFSIVKISGAEFDGLNVGSINAGSIYSSQNMDVAGNLNVREGITVQSGIASYGDLNVMGSGTSTIGGKLHLNSGLQANIGDIKQLPGNIFSTSTLLNAGGATMSWSVASGKFIYASANNTHTVKIFNVNTATATQIANLSETTGARRTISPTGLAISGNYLYLLNGATRGSTDAKIAVIDISEPENPTYVSSIATANQDNMREIKINGKYAYVLQNGSPQVLIYDISSSTNPVEVRTINNISRLPSTSNGAMEIRGNYLYVVGSTGSGTRIGVIDITNPLTATSTGFSSVTGAGAAVTKSFGIAIQGNYAYVTTNGTSDSGGLAIINIASSTNPIDTGRCLSSTDGSTHGPGGPIKIVGRYAYILTTSGSGDKLSVVDVGTPLTCSTVATVNSPTGGDVYDFTMQGKTMYIVGAKLGIVSLYGLDTPVANIGAIFGSNLELLDSLSVKGNSYLDGGINAQRDILTDGAFVSQSGTSTFMGNLLVNSVNDSAFGSIFLKSVTSTANFGALVAVASSTTLTPNDVPSISRIVFGATTVTSSAGFFVNGAENYDNHSVGIYALDLTSSTVGGAIFGARLCAGSTSANIMQLATDSDGSRFRVDCSGQIFADNGTVGTPGDYAEFFPTADTSLSAGEVVAMDGASVSSVRRAMMADREYTLGVISARPLITGNAGNDGERRNNPYYKVVGLLGQLPVKASNINGTILAGDKLMAGDDGYAVKAAGVGMIIGQAMEDFIEANGTVLSYVDPRWSGDGIFSGDSNVTNILPSGTADAVTTGYDSFGLTFNGSYWNGTTAVSSSFTLVNDVISAGNSLFSIKTADTALLTISELGNVSVTGDFTVGQRLFLGSKASGEGSTSTYIYIDDSLAPSSTYIATNADGWQSNSTYDYAERYESNETLEPGDLVITDPSGVNLVKRSTSSTETIIGIVSTKPGFITGAHSTGTYPIALAGRVPTRVSSANGVIIAGDRLAPSNVPGVAVKATGAGSTVGIALEAYDSPDIGVVSVFVQPGWYGGDLSGEAETVTTTTAVVTTVSQSQRSGLAKIYAGQTSVVVSFTSLNAYPIISLTPYGLAGSSWGVTQVSDTGFTIEISSPQAFDWVFAWKAEASPSDGTMSFSDGTSLPYDQTSGMPIGVVPVDPVIDSVVAPAIETVSTTEVILPAASSSPEVL